MTSKLIMLAGTALALLMMSAASIPAEARGGGHGFGGGGGHGFGGGGPQFGGGGPHFGRSGPRIGDRAQFSGGPRFQAHAFRAHPQFFRNRHHRRVFIGAPFAFGYNDYGGDCFWLRREALYTGSPYWWSRYYACIGAY
ncbi:MAG: hypothetical protein J2P50_00110 [Hyphomicrobiaceae bacterium]|nr:hypothetical protein [Hyphomicrobiaceae bacterium]